MRGGIKMALKCNDVINALEAFAPIEDAESWDNPGFLVGDRNHEIHKVLVALDVIDPVIDEAVKIGADMIVTHHPIVFGAVKKVTTDTPLGTKLVRLIKNNIDHYAAHTNLDAAMGGTNDVFAELIGLNDVKVLDVTNKEKLYKYAVFVPENAADDVRRAIVNAGGGKTDGNYCGCTFSNKEVGRFTPLEGANPTIGEINREEEVNEVKIETVVSAKNLSAVINAVEKVHPYEEAAYDIIPLEKTGRQNGIGRYGVLEEETTLKELALKVKEVLGLDAVRVVGDLDTKITKVGLCTGSAIEYMKKVKAKGCQVFITSDMRYHESQKALDNGLVLIDATHFASENIIVPTLCRVISEACPGIKVVASRVDGQVFKSL